MQRTKSLAFGVFLALAVVIAITPRLLPEIELSRRTVLWIPVLHQIILATLLCSMVWLGTGKRTYIAVASALLILLVLGPNLAGAIEYSLTGENETVFSLAESVGATQILNTVYPFLYDSIGYSLSIKQPT